MAKLIYASNKSTLAAPSTARTRLERHFDPGAILDLKTAAGRDLLVGGPNLAAQALVAGLPQGNFPSRAFRSKRAGGAPAAFAAPVP